MASIDKLLELMIQQKASDFHLCSDVQPMFRVHGSMVPVGDWKPLPSELVYKLVSEIMPQENKQEFESTNDTDFAYEIQGLSRFRVNVFQDLRGVGAVLRQISSTILSAQDLNLPAIVTRFSNLSKGLVVVTGPTGSGKSTTLAAMIDHINETQTDLESDLGKGIWAQIRVLFSKDL